jgi:hypothetical protein
MTTPRLRALRLPARRASQEEAIRAAQAAREETLAAQAAQAAEKAAAEAQRPAASETAPKTVRVSANAGKRLGSSIGQGRCYRIMRARAAER